MKDVHVIYTDYGTFGWGISSPQQPELIGGRSTIHEAIDDTELILGFAGFESGTYRLHQHEQKYVQSPNGYEFLVRFVSTSGADRHACVGRALHAISSGSIEADLPRMPSSPAGEHIIIAAEKSDRLGWILDQLSPGEGATVEIYEGEDVVYSAPIFDSDREGGSGKGLEELGLGRESTVDEMFDAVMAVEASDLRVVTKHTAIA